MDAPEVNPLLQRAAEALRERPVLFKFCAEEVASARHSALFSRWRSTPMIRCAAVMTLALPWHACIRAAMWTKCSSVYRLAWFVSLLWLTRVG